MIKQIFRLINSSILLIALTGCALLPAGQGQNSAQLQRGPTPTPIPTPIVAVRPTYVVERGEVVDSEQFLGRVAPVTEVELYFNTTGRVRHVNFEEDAVVHRGDIIADLEIDDLERDLAAAKLELERAEKQQAEAELTHQDALTRATLRYELAQAELAEATQKQAYDLKKATINRAIKQLELAKLENQNITARQVMAKADLAEAANALKPAQSAYDKIAYGDGSGASPEAIALQQATINYERAKAAYDLAAQEIKNHDYEVDSLKQQIALADLEISQLQDSSAYYPLQNALTEAKLDVDILNRGVDIVYQHNVERATLAVQKLEKAVADAQIIAPFDGTLLSVQVYEGREASAYKAVVVIADVTSLEVSANIDEKDVLEDLVEGMPVAITFATRPGVEAAGRITRLPYPYGGGGRTEDVGEGQSVDKSTRIAFDSTSIETLKLELGDHMQIEAVIEQKPNVLWVPPQAIRKFENRKFVVVQDGEVQRRVDVTTGIESDTRVEIKEGLTEGQIVVAP